MRFLLACLASFLVFNALDATAADLNARVQIPISRTTGEIRVDGDLGDAGWQGATAIDTWYESNPGDNTPARVKSVGYLVYDDKFFYAGFEFTDPEPGKIRAPLADRDNVSSATDYGGVIVDARNDGKTAIEFIANPRGVQFDAVNDDSSGNEDASPDFFWDSAAKITQTGWTLEIRIPFSSLRYGRADPQTWGIMLYRNYPREFRYRLTSNRIPRGSNCFVCTSNRIDGLSGLPSGGNLVLAPYLNGRQSAEPRGDLGTPLEHGPLEGDVGLDVKWTPFANSALDGTINPDFSQVESDVAQIGANERFALFYPEKRPFFLEGVDLFSTPIQALYTRTITSPRFGLRGTGRLGSTAFTALVVQDRGGGSVILPGPNGSDFADQEGRSFVAVSRLRRDLGSSFVSLLGSDREASGGGAYNRVFGPDFQWKPTSADRITGQFLMSWSRTPDRPDLADAWNGQTLRGHAADLWWNRTTKTYDTFAEYKDFGDDFRADNGFVPQVGFRETYAEAGYTFRPSGLVRRVRTYLIFDRSADRRGDLLNRVVSPGFGLDARWNSFLRARWSFERVRAGDETQTLSRSQLVYVVNTSPSRFLTDVSLEGYLGSEIDFANVRPSHGGDLKLGASLRPTDHLEVRLNTGRRWLDVDGPEGRSRLFTARVDRLRTTYNFTARSFVRLIGQYVQTTRDPALYSEAIARRDGGLSLSGLFAYKLNWQTVLFAGYGDNRALDENEAWQREGREFFLKVSYAFQR
jgi:Domain of unknown function (DUF5916)